MAVDPLRKVPINRGEQIQREPIEIGKGVKLYDVDLAIARTHDRYCYSLLR